VSVAAAANANPALDAIAAEFRTEHPGVQVVVRYGSSGLFFAQIESHARYDVFLSADETLPRELIDDGYAEKESEFRYARGALALWVPRGSTLDLERLGMTALLDPQVHTVAIADPQHTSDGRATIAAMRRLGVYPQAAEKLVECNDTGQAARFVAIGRADAAFIGTPLAISFANKELGRYWEVPLETYPTLIESGVVVRGAEDPVSAQAFRAFLVGPEGRAIFERFGFLLPPP
jgi:molybdate transport system substrate-binding protein